MRDERTDYQKNFDKAKEQSQKFLTDYLTSCRDDEEETIPTTVQKLVDNIRMGIVGTFSPAEMLHLLELTELGVCAVSAMFDTSPELTKEIVSEARKRMKEHRDG